MFNQISVRPEPPALCRLARRCASRDCTDFVTATRRKYCKHHGEQASVFRKREVRLAERDAYKKVRQVDPSAKSPHLKSWPSRDLYNEYTRAAMRAARARRMPASPESLAALNAARELMRECRARRTAARAARPATEHAA